jgi:hypothetical protein
MKKLGIFVVTVVFLLGCVSLANAYEVYSPSPLNSTDIVFNIVNNGPGTITEMDFSFITPYDFRNFISIELSPGINYVIFADNYFQFDSSENAGWGKFNFDITGFTPGKQISMQLNLNIVTDAFYDPSVNELADNIMVTILGTDGKYCGLMEILDDRLEANFCHFIPNPPGAPLPGTLLLLSSGILGLLGFRYRKA